MIQRLILGVIASVLLEGCNTLDTNATLNHGNGAATTAITSKPTRADKVVVYQSKLPKHYRSVGRVSADQYNFVGMTIAEASILKELKEQAAKLGANGIMNLSNGLAKTTAEAIVVK